jgi:hypothetical protein
VQLERNQLFERKKEETNSLWLLLLLLLVYILYIYVHIQVRHKSLVSLCCFCFYPLIISYFF